MWVASYFFPVFNSDRFPYHYLFLFFIFGCFNGTLKERQDGKFNVMV